MGAEWTATWRWVDGRWQAEAGAGEDCAWLQMGMGDRRRESVGENVCYSYLPVGAEEGACGS